MKKNKRLIHTQIFLSLILLLSIALAGCQNTQVAGGAATSSPVPSDTPAPTSTVTPLPTETPTLTPTVTRTATPDRKATLAVKKTATQAAINEIVNADLTKYGIDPTLGHVAWVMNQPVILDGSGYAMGFFEPIKELGVVKDFVVQSEVTWDTSGGLSGCGYIFRAPDDWDMKIGDFYTYEMIRLQYSPTWFISYFKDGRWTYALPSRDGVSSANILDTKLSKNLVTLDVHGDSFTLYINGVKERTIQNNKIAEGGLAFEVTQESGTSYCKFENAWVWEYDN